MLYSIFRYLVGRAKNTPMNPSSEGILTSPSFLLKLGQSLYQPLLHQPLPSLDRGGFSPPYRFPAPSIVHVILAPLVSCGFENNIKHFIWGWLALLLEYLYLLQYSKNATFSVFPETVIQANFKLVFTPMRGLILPPTRIQQTSTGSGKALVSFISYLATGESEFRIHTRKVIRFLFSALFIKRLPYSLDMHCSSLPIILSLLILFICNPFLTRSTKFYYMTFRCWDRPT